MPRPRKAKKKPTIISFISGKGGVGKTALTASVGKLLALMGYKVLIVDSDLITHGMTFLLGFDSKKAGLLEVCKTFIDSPEASQEERKTEEVVRSFVERFVNKIICELNNNLHFLQSTSLPSERYSDLVFSEGEDIALCLELILENYIKSGIYDFILIDTQAGAVKTTETMVSISDKVVTIMEPDPVATYATENVLGEFRDFLPRDSFYVINKLSVEEASAYEAIEKFLRILRHLPPVPFDFEVRRAFMIREIPVDEKKPSSFLFGIIRMIRDLLPNISDNLDSLEKRVEEIAVLPIKEKMQSIEHELDRSITAEVDMKKHLDELKEKRTRPLQSLKAILIVSMGLTLIFFIVFFLPLLFGVEIAGEFPFQMAAGITSSITAIYAAFIYWRRMPRKEREQIDEIEKELAKLKESQSRMRGEYESYRNLLITRSKELTLKEGERTKNDN